MSKSGKKIRIEYLVTYIGNRYSNNLEASGQDENTDRKLHEFAMSSLRFVL
jgi:hypothetical protein